MCGITGYISKTNNANTVAINCLKNLEYRGYDSSGIAIFNENKIKLYKSTGKIANLCEKIKDIDTTSKIAIAHTRWATHGKPTETNAHPHRCKNITLVHNGIIENYIELKEFLQKNGYTFNTQTDTEVACAYIAYVYNDLNIKDKLKCINEACKNLKGSYAFGIIFDDEPETLYATRKDSPLIVGYGDNGNFISSDITAIIKYTNKYVILNDYYISKITCDKVENYDENLNLVNLEIKTSDLTYNENTKNGYSHYMLKEIHEEPTVIANLYKRYLDKDIATIDLKKFDKIHIVACGSAMHAGLIGKYLFETYARIETTVEIASEYRYKNPIITDKTLVIIISQSGETADTLAALRLANNVGAYTLAIVNQENSSIAREAKKCLYTYAGPEIAVATTKGYTSQVAVLSIIMINSLKNNNLKDTILKETATIENVLEKTIDMLPEYKNIANKIYEKNDIFFIGRGIDYALCMEGSLKLKEISYIHSEAYAAGELKHGTISLIENGTPVIAIATDETLFEKTVSNVKETKARGAYTIFITTKSLADNTDVDDFSDVKLILNDMSKINITHVVALALQLISFETAKLKNCDIDKPKNLAKSVTVE